MTLSHTPEAAFLFGTTWRLWANFWLRGSNYVPPLHLLGEGVFGSVTVVSSVRRHEQAAFLAAQHEASGCVLRDVGDAPLDPARWFGHWSAFSIARASGDVRFPEA